MPDPTTTAAKLRAMLDLDVLDVSAVKDALAIIEPKADESRRKLDPQTIIDMAIEVVCPGMSGEFYSGSYRDEKVVAARRIAVGLIRDICPLFSYPDIARLMGSGLLAHATAMTRMRRFELLTKTKPDPEFIAQVDAVRAAVIAAHNKASSR